MKDASARPATAQATPEDILATYDRVAEAFARSRDRTLYERRWLDRALAHVGGRRVLDLGCGTGLPIAAYLQDRRGTVTGVDGAAAMLAIFARNLPRARAIHTDMRGLDLGETFDVILAWNSLFHLSADDQRDMFKTFRAHAHPRSVLLFTTGPGPGEAVGRAGGAPVYHASLAPEDYRALLAEQGFEEIAFVPEDPACKGHSVWLARLRDDG
ncbi:class I SAM-dependent methyltransferase [Maritimibacter sp. HL-12]|uniref:class I SAM-dependent DNA methyltransferase n=1 Tax=Maritimibacter sp. HL-12 TaxID=1162418 RepID=UPI000A0F3F51|nr:class I SAM-dependent methyltransferase [Maritimibacter sp. HL-12]SMH57340.1 Methyltransferase domain-containing protein [Maritimibacter sp. HL-12]